MRTKAEAERQIREIIEKSGGELDICPRCRGTGFDFISGNPRCGDCIGRGVIDKENWVEDHQHWQEVVKRDEEYLEIYFQQHPEERAEWKKVRPEDKEGEYCMITEYSDTFPEHLDKLTELYPDWWYWKRHKGL